MDQLIIEDLVIGTGAAPTSGQKITVHYTGWLTNGTKFDSSKDRRDPFVFNLGRGQVIKGWDEGVQGMRVGGKRRLIIPSPLAYGTRGVGSVVPPNATLVYEVELLRITRGGGAQPIQGRGRPLQHALGRKTIEILGRSDATHGLYQLG